MEALEAERSAFPRLEVGATYRVVAGMTLFGGYSTNNRAPTPSEIECSDPSRPCLLPPNLAGDPPTLRQVVARTLEFGARCHAQVAAGEDISWNASVFRANLVDDIYGAATSASTGFFQNIGSTRRQGFESAITFRDAKWSLSGQFSLVDATFRSPLTLYSPSNPRQDAGGDIHVQPDDRLPLVPRGCWKLAVEYAASPARSLGATLGVVDGSFYRGDESNQNAALPGFTVAGIHTSFRVNRRTQLFARVQNLFGARYSTYELLGDPTGVGAPGVPAGANPNGAGIDNRFQSPAMPRAAFTGIKVSL